jgi:hypothetical protein
MENILPALHRAVFYRETVCLIRQKQGVFAF